MKKLFSLLLVFAMILSLCACDRKGEDVTLVFNEKTTISDYEITITDFFFSDKAYHPEKSDGAIVPNDGYTCANISFLAKYNGKTKSNFPFFGAQIDYNNGYTFETERQWFYDTSINAWLNSGEIEPLTPEFSCQYSFFVPNEVKENKENPLNVIFYLNKTRIICSIRPMDDGQIKNIYNIANKYMEDGKYKSAAERYETIADYADSASLLNKAKELNDLCSLGQVGNNTQKIKTHFTEKLDKYSTLNGDEIQSIILGKWYDSKTSKIWNFKEDETVEVPVFGNIQWKIEGDFLSYTDFNSSSFNNYVIKKVDNNIYILVLDGQPYTAIFRKN